MNLGLEINIWIMDSNFFGLLKFLENIGGRNIKECQQKFGVEKNFGGGEKFREFKRNRGKNFGG